MKSSSCKYVLEKVLKFEKKYAKVHPNSRKEDKESTTFQSNDSVSSESLDIGSGSKARSKSDNDSERNLSREKNDELILCRSKPLENLIVSSSSDYSLQSVGRISYGRKPIEVQKDKSIQKNTIKKLVHKSISRINSDVTLWNDNFDNNVALVEVEKNKALHEKHQKNEFLNEIVNEPHKFDENILAQNHMEIIRHDKIEGATLEISGSVYESEEQGKENCVRKCHNINVDTCDDISDVASSTIDSLSVQNENSVSNVSLQVLTFQDLNVIEKLKSSPKKFDNLSIKSNSNNYSQVMQDYSKATSYLEENFSNGTENSDTIGKSVVSKTLSEMENSEEPLTKIKSEDESSIEEEIEDEIKCISSDLSDQIPAISGERKNLSKSGVNTEVNVTIAVNRELYDHDVKSDLSYSNTGFEGKCVEANKNRIINNKQGYLLPGSKLREIHEEINKKGNNKIENAMVYAKRENSCNKMLGLPKDRHNKIHKQTDKCDNERMVNDLKRDYEEKKYSVHSLHDREKIFQTSVHHASAQTETYLLLENDEFERKMESIMKSSFVSISNADAPRKDFQRNFDDQAFQGDITQAAASSSSSSSSLTPIERGFYCSLKQQVELTKHFIQAEYNMYLACVTAIKELSSTYKPATLHHSRISRKKKSRKERIERMETV